MLVNAATAAERPDLATFWKAWDLAQANFVYRDALDQQKMLYGAIRGMIDALGDDGHTRFLTPEDVATERSTLTGRFDGIGAEVNVRNGRPVVVAPIEDSPAEKAGLLPGDTILSVDGQDVSSASLGEIVSKVRGPRGTIVRLGVLHPGQSSSVDLSIERGPITVRSVTWVLVPGTSLAHVRINRFAGGTTQELKDALAAGRAAGAQGFVLDLRNNPGGLLNEAVSASSQFLKDGNVLLEENAKGERTPYPVKPDGLAIDTPIVVLVNRGSASASEIFAGAIQDHERAPIVGEQTYGTGTVLSTFDLGDGSEIYLGTAQWLTPNGRAIRKVGVKPDVVVALSGGARPVSPSEERAMTADQLAARGDAQLAKAIEILGASRGADGVCVDDTHPADGRC